jgi:hypothetical protein
MPLFSKEGPFILQLDNIIVGKRNGVYSSELLPRFFQMHLLKEEQAFYMQLSMHLHMTSRQR